MTLDIDPNIMKMLVDFCNSHKQEKSDVANKAILQYIGTNSLSGSNGKNLLKWLDDNQDIITIINKARPGSHY